MDLPICWCRCCGLILKASDQKRCGKCKIALYCSEKCQREHWKFSKDGTELGHRRFCGKVLPDTIEMYQSDLEFAAARCDTHVKALERILFAHHVSNWDKDASFKPTLCRAAGKAVGMYLGGHHSTVPLGEQYLGDLECRVEKRVCDGSYPPGPQWKTILWGVLQVIKLKASALHADVESVTIHVIGVRSWAEGVTDWPELRHWLRVLAWKRLERLTIFLSGFFENQEYERDLNDISLQKEWANICMKKDPALHIELIVGPWHEHAKTCAQPDVAVLLNPGFQSQMSTWSNTLSELKGMGQKADYAVPLLVSGQSIWDRKEIYRNTSDVRLYEQILSDFGFKILTKREPNPFAQLYPVAGLHSTSAHHPNVVDALMSTNGFLLVAARDSKVESLHESEIHRRACITLAESSLLMEKSFEYTNTPQQFLVQAYERIIPQLKSSEITIPFHSDVADVKDLATSVAQSIQQEALVQTLHADPARAEKLARLSDDLNSNGLLDRMEASMKRGEDFDPGKFPDLKTEMSKCQQQ